MNTIDKRARIKEGNLDLEQITVTHSREAIQDPVDTQEIHKKGFHDHESIRSKFEVSEDFPRKASEAMLFDMARDILTGASKEEVSEAEFVYIEQFMRRLVDINPEEIDSSEIERRTRIEGFVNHELTKKLRGLLAYSENSILAEQRKLLGITSADDEKPFDVKVISFPEHADDYFKRQEFWDELTDGRPSLFMTRNETIDGVLQGQIIYLSEDHLEELLATDNPSRTFLHEYRHTQRSFAYGSDQLFRFFDEITADMGEYENISAQLRLLTLTTESMDYGSFFQAYEEDDEEKKVDLLRQFAKSFGTVGLMVLGGRKSSEHSEDRDGIEDIPLASVNIPQQNEALQFFETMLAYREKQDPNWISIFRDRLKDQGGNYRAFLDILRSYLFSKTTAELEDSDAQRTRQLVDAIDAEMKRRAALGEPDFNEAYMQS